MIVISLGSNLGNRLDNLWKALKLIERRCLENVRSSIILETEAILPEHSEADWNKPFLNMIISGQTHLSPQDLLKELKNIERIMGRPEIYKRWAPRIIDLDILLYNDLIMNTVDLVIPHPEIKNRPFLKHLLSLMKITIGTLENLEDLFIKTYLLQPRLVGIVNITADSFSDGGKFYDTDKAVDQILHLEQNGASIVEIGAQSTKPGVTIQPIEDEYTKLDKVLNQAEKIVSDKKIKMSLDTFHPSIALKLIQKYNIALINDVKGNFDDDSLREIANSGCQFCLMHSLTIPPNKIHVIPRSVNTIEYLMEWGENALERLGKLGFSIDRIVLDPGIGFGKTPYQNIEILRNIGRFKSLGCPIMIGHSRKSYIHAFSKERNACNRDMETIAVSLAIGDKADFLRVHNVRDHMREMVADHVVRG